MTNDELLEQLRAKLRGKMEVAKFFSGFISVVFGFLLKEGLGGSNTEVSPVVDVSPYIAIAMFVAALTFSIATIFAYDRLLMPTPFWETPLDPFFLRHEMVKAWRWLFVPAVFALILGLFAAVMSITKLPAQSAAIWGIPSFAALVAYLISTRKVRFND